MNLRQRINLLFFGAVGLAAGFLSATQVHAANPCQAEWDARFAAITACLDTGNMYACYSCLGNPAFKSADLAFRECIGSGTPLISPGSECEYLGTGSSGSSGNSGNSGCSGNSGNSGC